MSSKMDYETTVQKLREGRLMKPDFEQNWTGAMVGKHLYNAGLCRMRGDSYVFPGYMHFPINLFDSSEAQLPFKLKNAAGQVNFNFANQMLVIHKGLQEYYAMKNHYYWMGMEIQDRANRQSSVPTPENLAPTQKPKKNIVPQRADSRRTNEIIPADAQPSIDQNPNIDVDPEINPQYQEADIDEVHIPDVNPSTMSDFGVEDQAALRQEALDEFGPQSVRNQSAANQAQNSAEAAAINQVPQQAPNQNAVPVDDVPNRRVRRARRRLPRQNQAVDNESVSARVAPDDELEQLNDMVALATIISAFTNANGMSNGVEARNDNAPGDTAQVSPIPEYDVEIENPNVEEATNAPNATAPNAKAAEASNVQMQNTVANDPGTGANAPEGASNIQPADLDENGLPTARQSVERATPGLIAAMKKLGKSRKPSRKTKTVPEVHTLDPAELIRQALEEHKYEWIDRLGGRPNLSDYYNRIDEMVMEHDRDPVDIQRYLDVYETPATRFNALIALTDKATDGSISIDRYTANGPIRSFRREA
ncbi:uncharacterized protein LOC129573182 [Sitodiplosis mosellana]|uniref:uncharacterized protein LOC129573182 n=1 Tax=Sitodiplosis mosellana TaxID=263140 RepID=UPI0024441FBC|nr:uncharacterized protein LOC129573182 [Sitodiplosis mosellana]